MRANDLEQQVAVHAPTDDLDVLIGESAKILELFIDAHLPARHDDNNNYG